MKIVMSCVMVHKSNSKSLLYAYYMISYFLTTPTTNFYFASVQIALSAEDKKPGDLNTLPKM